ncbi:recombination protein RecR [Candidatus Dojkabacteria bacterium]|uniref:Recombination protein RecR n=1 Tax=Candidatus Dojkabacteria bacterium TaxID=2099670 RepID=A0A955L9X7_9BACT|nr:recombination protein RecR [Candidatus Dojkabacteria bacterium]
MNLLPKDLEKLLEQFQKLPGIGPKSAARLAYSFLEKADSDKAAFIEVIKGASDRISRCTQCCNYSESSLCKVCDSSERQDTQILVVEEPMDAYTFESTGTYEGMYHILGGLISPVNGVGPNEISVDQLIKRIKKITGEGREVEIILGITLTLEGEATASHIVELIRVLPEVGGLCNFTTLARGLPSGADLDYADTRTLQNAFNGRSQY